MFYLCNLGTEKKQHLFVYSGTSGKTPTITRSFLKRQSEMRFEKKHILQHKKHIPIDSGKVHILQVFYEFASVSRGVVCVVSNVNSICLDRQNAHVLGSFTSFIRELARCSSTTGAAIAEYTYKLYVYMCVFDPRSFAAAVWCFIFLKPPLWVAALLQHK